MNGTIRHAEPNDLPAIIDMGHEFFDHSGYSDIATFEESSFVATAIALMSGIGGGSLLVAEVGERAVGMAASVIFPFYANRNIRIGQEVFWWVGPDYRSGIGASLMDELEAEAMRSGADIFMNACLAGQRDQAMDRIYRKRGYRPAENTYIRRLSS